MKLTQAIQIALLAASVLLSQPGSSWAQLEQTPTGSDTPVAAMSAGTDEARQQKLRQKLDKIVLPQLAFQDASVGTVLDYIRDESIKRDSEQVGVNIILLAQLPADRKLTMHLQDIPVGVALQYVAQLAGLQSRVEASAVVLTKAPAPVEPAEPKPAPPVAKPAEAPELPPTSQPKPKPAKVAESVPTNAPAVAPGAKELPMSAQVKLTVSSAKGNLAIQLRNLGPNTFDDVVVRTHMQSKYSSIPIHDEQKTSLMPRDDISLRVSKDGPLVGYVVEVFVNGKMVATTASPDGFRIKKPRLQPATPTP